ncbi:hypothetical protein BT69DRAFT_633724 [Atractiella rhizophila]|nr:hypothetical protein BT69DRAFT_633724 [Atractiella rhizophila]
MSAIHQSNPTIPSRPFKPFVLHLLHLLRLGPTIGPCTFLMVLFSFSLYHTLMIKWHLVSKLPSLRLHVLVPSDLSIPGPCHLAALKAP